MMPPGQGLQVKFGLPKIVVGRPLHARTETTEESLTGNDLVSYLSLVSIYLAWPEDVDSQFEAKQSLGW